MTLTKDKHAMDLDFITSFKLSSANTQPQLSEKIDPRGLQDELRLAQTLSAQGLEDFRLMNRPSYFPINSEEEERKRISQELHDGLGQILTSISLHVQSCLNRFDQDEAVDTGSTTQQRESLESISDMVKQAITEVRSICRAIRPAILDDLGVVAAIRWQCRQISQGCSNLEVTTDFDINEEVLSEEYKNTLYRIVQECLNNAVKYAQAKSISVSLLQSHNAIHLVVVDDGVGFDPSQIQGKLGMGLVGMRERAESVQGKLRIDTGLNEGVQVRASFPLFKSTLNG
ncbi:MAG: sensor histidine kinase [Candidatus Thiodiazotropha sp.]